MELEKEIQQRGNGSRAWPYLFSGVIIGSVIGVLFAPESGKRSRDKLGSWLQEKRQQANKTLSTANRVANRAFESTSRQTHHRRPERSMTAV